MSFAELPPTPNAPNDDVNGWPVVEALELKEGDDIEIHVVDARDFAVARKPDRKELLKRLRAFRGRLPADFKFDRDEANAR